MVSPCLKSPGSGAKRVDLKPVFQWSAIAGVGAYELLVTTDVYFANLVIERVGDFVLPTTVWQCDINLDYDTTYYWKVRGLLALMLMAFGVLLVSLSLNYHHRSRRLCPQHQFNHHLHHPHRQLSQPLLSGSST